MNAERRYTVAELRDLTEANLEWRREDGKAEGTVDVDGRKIRQFLDWLESKRDG